MSVRPASITRLFPVNFTSSVRPALLVAMAMVACSATNAMADITGFNNLSGWTYNPGDAGSPPVLLNSNSIELTTGPNNNRSLWFNTPQNITNFTAHFTFRSDSISASALRQGLTFTLQNAGINALGGGGNGYGYSGISPSKAVTLETDTGPGRTYSGVFTNGVLAGGSADTSPVNAFDFQDINVTITYNGSVLSTTMVEGANVFGPQNNVVGSLATTLGSSTAYIGFTAGTFNTLGSGGGAHFFLSNFSYSVPAPTTAALLGIGGLLTARRRR